MQDAEFRGWGVACVDEGHRLRNSDALLFDTLTSTTFKYVRHRVVLTGTPIQNNLGELCAVLGWLHPGSKFNDEETFVAKFGTLSSASAELRDEFTALLRPHILRRTKDDVLRTLPARHEVLVPVPLAAPQAGEVHVHSLTRSPISLWVRVTSLCRAIQGSSGKKLRAAESW
jgi:SNF2 family DNA or RNA helicase